MPKSVKVQASTLITVARDMAARITALPKPATDEQVLEVMENQECSRRMLCDAFWLMDNEPSRFAEHQTWHPRLRSLRNNPTVGERMFALFQ